jgi:uncharacterized protein (TIGR02246 family)
MRSIRIATPLVLTMGLILSACQQQGTETGEMEETPADSVATVSDEDQLDALRSDYEVAWEAHDVDAMVAMMTPDYREIGPLGSFDRAGAEAMMRDSTSMAPQGATISIDMQTKEIADSGDVAYASGQSTVTIPQPDGTDLTQTQDWVVGFKKVDGAWKIDRLALGPPPVATEGEDTGTM